MTPTPYVLAGLGDILPWMVFVFMIIGAISNVIKERKAAEEIKQRSRRANPNRNPNTQDDLSNEIEAFLLESAGEQPASATDAAVRQRRDKQKREKEEAQEERRQQQMLRQQREKELQEQRERTRRQEQRRQQSQARRTGEVVELTTDDLLEPESSPRRKAPKAGSSTSRNLTSGSPASARVADRHLESQVETRHLDSSVSQQHLAVGTVAPLAAQAKRVEGSPIAREIGAMMQNPEDVRRAVMLTEILSKPRALGR